MVLRIAIKIKWNEKYHKHINEEKNIKNEDPNRVGWYSQMENYKKSEENEKKTKITLKRELYAVESCLPYCLCLF